MELRGRDEVSEVVKTRKDENIKSLLLEENV